MNPSDQNDLIAYHLHELSPRQERSLHRRLQNDAAVAAESEAIAATLRAFPKSEATLPINSSVLERNWLAMRPSLAVHLPKPFARAAFLRWSLPALAGCALATTVLLMSLHHHRQAQPSTTAMIATTSQATPALSLSADSSASPSSNLSPSVSTPRPWITNHPWPSPSTPAQSDNSQPSDNPQTSLNVLPPEPSTLQSPAQSSPAEPSPANTSVASAEGSASLSSNTPPAPSSTQSDTVRQPSKAHRPHPVDLTLSIFGNLADAHASYSTFLQEESPVVGVLASYHEQLHPLLGYRVTATYSRSAFTYTNVSPNTISEGIYELSGTYTVQGPHNQRINSSVEAGGGLLSFSSINPYQSATGNTHTFRPAAVIGVASELTLSKRWALHAEYRALFYRTPDIYPAYYPANGTPTPGNVALTFSSQPTIGITYRFGTKSTD